MNQPQINSLVRSLLKVAGTVLTAHGLTSTATWINSEDVLGMVVLLVGLWQSHQVHGSIILDGGARQSAATSAPAQATPPSAPVPGTASPTDASHPFQML